MIEDLRFIEREVDIQWDAEGKPTACQIQRILQYFIDGQWVDVPMVKE